MAEQTANESTLDQLQTPQQVILLDKIDELRSEGLGHHGISLPQLIVCGDQSSGKSSLLESLTRLRFPTKEKLCTTFATEVVLRRAINVEITCTITPSETRTKADKLRLSKFERKFASPETFAFPKLIDDAKDLMANGVETRRNDFFEDVLRVKYSSPDAPSLTIVDLPGMFDEELNGGNGAERVMDIVTRYMSNEKSIILAVVEAGNDLPKQRIFKPLRKYDEKRSRTLGVITKPDKVDQGGDLEKDVMSLAKNEIYPLRHGWHVVRNRGLKEMHQTDIERDETERQFFRTGLWSCLLRENVGISALRTKLSRILLEHITTELPSLVDAIQSAISSTAGNLKALGNARETSRDQRAYLTGNAEKFQMLTSDALRGIYSHPFFGLASPEFQTPARLRTVIQNLNIAFADVMYRKGHTWDITIDQSPESTSASFPGASHPAVQEYGEWFEDPTSINRAVFLENHIGTYVQQSRPSGLPSLVNPWVIGEVFREQSKSWRDIAKHHLQQVYGAMRKYIEEVLGSLMDPRTFNLLMLNQIQSQLDDRWSNVEAKLEELLIPYTEQDPITYDPGFIRDLEELRATRHRLQSMQASFKFGQNTPMKPSSNANSRLLTESLDDFTNSEILDLMQTYYKSAISVFINNIAVLAIENCLIKDLTAIFSPTLTANMEDEELQAIAAESEEVRSERSYLKQKMEALQAGKRVLHEHIATRPSFRTKPSVTPSRSPAPRAPISRTPTPQPTILVDETVKETKQEPQVESPPRPVNVITPPASGLSTPIPSRRRKDSAASTMSNGSTGRKRSAWPPRFAASEDSDDQL